MGAVDTSDKLANKCLSKKKVNQQILSICMYDLNPFHFALLGIYVIMQAIRVHAL